jgi:hypothetical protein
MGSEHAQIEFVHTTADLFIGRKANSNESVFPFCLPEQPLDQSHDHRDARFIAESKEMARIHGARWFTLHHDLIDWFGTVIEPSTIVTNRRQLSIA